MMVKDNHALHDPALLELMPTAVYVVDELGCIRCFNQKACEFWGRTPKLMDTDERFCGAFKLYLTNGQPLPHDQTPMAKAVIAGESCRNTEVVIERPDGSQIIVMVNISPIRDESGRIVGAINCFQDVTEIVRARRELEMQRRELESAVAARDAFLSICSHELKTPLTSLKFQSQIAKRKLEKNEASVLAPENVRRMVEQNESQINRLTRLVDDMLDVVRIQTNKLSIQPAEANLTALLRELVERCAPDGADAPRVSCDVEEDIIGFFDAGRIEQVVLNLLLNAFKYGGKKPIEVECRRVGSRAILSVRDHGMGIAEADLGRIFERFERAVPGTNVSGLGLGLYVSKEIIEAHGGCIHVQSELGKGSTFTLEFPLQNASVPLTDVA